MKYLLASIFFLVSWAAGAQEYVVIDVADDYRVVHQARERNLVITELAPQGQSAENWRELYTLTSVRKHRGETLDAALRPHMAPTTNSCARQQFSLLARGEANGFPTATFLAACVKSKDPRLPEEWILGRVHLGNVDVHYTLKAWRYQPSKREIDVWRARLEKTFVCRGDNSDPATCPN